MVSDKELIDRLNGYSEEGLSYMEIVAKDIFLEKTINNSRNFELVILSLLNQNGKDVYERKFKK